MTKLSDSDVGATRGQLFLSWLFVIGVAVFVVGNVGRPGWPFYRFVDHRLQAYLTPNEKIVTGSRLKPSQLEAQWKWFTEAESEDLVGVAAYAAGRYAIKDIKPNTPILKWMVSETPPVEPNGMFVVVPVEVKAIYAAAMHPGLQLAFTKEGRFLPIDFQTQSRDTAYVLRSIAPLAGPVTEVTFFVEVPLTQIADIRSLVEGIWTPLVVAEKQSSTRVP
jgi:hypothetical protein